MNKHDLINESRDELQDKSLEEVLAGEPRDEKVDDEKNVRREFRAGE